MKKKEKNLPPFARWPFSSVVLTCWLSHMFEPDMDVFQGVIIIIMMMMMMMMMMIIINSTRE